MLFQGTLCGGAWARDKESAARLGCCPKGSYMSSPEKEPFTEETSCKQCPIGVRFYIANAELNMIDTVEYDSEYYVIIIYYLPFFFFLLLPSSSFFFHFLPSSSSFIFFLLLLLLSASSSRSMLDQTNGTMTHPAQEYVQQVNQAR